MRSMKRTPKRNSKKTPSGIDAVAAPTFEIVNGPLASPQILQLSNWCLGEPSDVQAARKIGISVGMLLRARNGKILYARNRKKIIDFLAKLPTPAVTE
jgi:hypothetical protein